MPSQEQGSRASESFARFSGQTECRVGPERKQVRICILSRPQARAPEVTKLYRLTLPLHHVNLSSVLTKLYLVHELIDQEDAAAVVGVEILAHGARGNSLGIEALARIAHNNQDAALLVAGHHALHDFAGILFGAVDHGVGQSFL